MHMHMHMHVHMHMHMYMYMYMYMHVQMHMYILGHFGSFWDNCGIRAARPDEMLIWLDQCRIRSGSFWNDFAIVEHLALTKRQAVA